VIAVDLQGDPITTMRRVRARNMARPRNAWNLV
jgi:hypothetical protein